MRPATRKLPSTFESVPPPPPGGLVVAQLLARRSIGEAPESLGMAMGTAAVLSDGNEARVGVFAPEVEGEERGKVE